MPSLLTTAATEEFPAFLTVSRPGEWRSVTRTTLSVTTWPRSDVRVIDASSFEIWRKVVSPDAGCAAGQVVRPKLDCCYMAIFRWTARLPGKSVEKRLAI